MSLVQTPGMMARAMLRAQRAGVQGSVVYGSALILPTAQGFAEIDRLEADVCRANPALAGLPQFRAARIVLRWRRRFEERLRALIRLAAVDGRALP